MIVLGMQVQPASIRVLPHFFSFSRTAAFGSDRLGHRRDCGNAHDILHFVLWRQDKQAKASFTERRPASREADVPTRLSMFRVLPLDVLLAASYFGAWAPPMGSQVPHWGVLIPPYLGDLTQPIAASEQHHPPQNHLDCRQPYSAFGVQNFNDLLDAQGTAHAEGRPDGGKRRRHTAVSWHPCCRECELKSAP